ncbi:hypothetical protein [Natrinema gelatinilyticum]|uniref:hypothetical protein n=1 Tax=Natrinema gelatinilyticum TaxID=2961571 RepID=UPI0020C29481|nr:hypothetical protein [Natrinema gelatinilyticum]
MPPAMNPPKIMMPPPIVALEFGSQFTTAATGKRGERADERESPCYRKGVSAQR